MRSRALPVADEASVTKRRGRLVMSYIYVAMSEVGYHKRAKPFKSYYPCQTNPLVSKDSGRLLATLCLSEWICTSGRLLALIIFLKVRVK